MGAIDTGRDDAALHRQGGHAGATNPRCPLCNPSRASTGAGACPDPEHPDGAFCTNTTGLATCYPPASTGAGAALPERFDLRERLAALEHEQWIEWSRTIAAEGLTPERVERWQRYWVPYHDLDEGTKDHDRKWADKALDLMASSPAVGLPTDDDVTAELHRVLCQNAKHRSRFTGLCRAGPNIARGIRARLGGSGTSETE